MSKKLTKKELIQYLVSYFKNWGAVYKYREAIRNDTGWFNGYDGPSEEQTYFTSGHPNSDDIGEIVTIKDWLKLKNKINEVVIPDTKEYVLGYLTSNYKSFGGAVNNSEIIQAETGWFIHEYNNKSIFANMKNPISSPIFETIHNYDYNSEMEMIEKSKSYIDKHSKFTVLNNIVKEKGIDKNLITAQDVLDYLFGTEYNDSDYTIHHYDEKRETTFWNRINLCWVYPIFFITIPFQWLIKGDTGINRNSKIGKIVDKLIKF